MATLTMVLRTIDGLVLGSDVPPGLSEQPHPIRSLSAGLAVVVHDDWQFGNQILDNFLASSPDVEQPIETIARQACESFRSQCDRLVAQDGAVPLVGFLLAEVRSGRTPSSNVFGMFVGNKFEPTPFPQQNLLGGQFISVARLLDQKLYMFGLPTRHALARAALYYAETRSLTVAPLDPDTSLATVTERDGLGFVSQGEVHELLSNAARTSERIFSEAGIAFYGSQ